MCDEDVAALVVDNGSSLSAYNPPTTRGAVDSAHNKMTENTVKIINVIDELMNIKKTRSIENIVDICERDFSWSNDESNENIKIALEEEKIAETNYFGKPGLRIVDQNINVCITDSMHNVGLQTDENSPENAPNSVPKNENAADFVSVSELKLFQSRIEEMLLNITTRPNSTNPTTYLNYEHEYIHSLQNRIEFLEKSLEKSLENQQKLFSQLLMQNEKLYDKISASQFQQINPPITRSVSSSALTSNQSPPFINPSTNNLNTAANNRTPVYVPEIAPLNLEPHSQQINAPPPNLEPRDRQENVQVTPQLEAHDRPENVRDLLPTLEQQDHPKIATTK